MVLAATDVLGPGWVFLVAGLNGIFRPNDLVNIRPNSSAEAVIRDATDLTSSVASWLLADHDNLTGKVLRLPERVEIDTPVQEQLIVELYSK